MKNAGEPLDDVKIDVKIKISALWASVMFCYIYADYFGLYEPNVVRGMLEGNMAPLGKATPGVLLGTSLMMAIPSLMIFLSLALRPIVNRRVNVALGVLYTVIILVTMWGSALYVFWGVIEVALTALVVWYAWNWPRRE